MRIMVLEPDKSPEIKNIKNTLENFQAIVGGYIECISIKNKIDLWVNEEGLLLDLPFNIEINGYKLFGTIFATGSPVNGISTGLSDKQIQILLKSFKR